MTIIIGLVDTKKTYIASDNLISAGSDRVNCDYPIKIFNYNNLYIGCAGETSLGLKLDRVLKLPEHLKGKSNFDYLNKDVIPALSELFEKHLLNYKDGKATLLLVYKDIVGKLFSDLGFIPSKLEAIGSGADYAKGSLYASSVLRPKMPAKEKITLALQAAVDGSTGCRPPFYIIEAPR